MKKAFYILSIFFPTIIVAQTQSLNLQLIGDSLKSVNIDTFIVYRNYYPGSVEMISENKDATEAEIREELCEKSDAVFVLYKKHGRKYIYKINECYNFKHIFLDTCEAYTLLLDDFNIILNEKILKFTLINNEGDTVSVSSSHGKFTGLYLSLGAPYKLFMVSWFDLRESSSEKNLNYHYNINTKTYQLLLAIEDKLAKETFTKD